MTDPNWEKGEGWWNLPRSEREDADSWRCDHCRSDSARDDLWMLPYLDGSTEVPLCSSCVVDELGADRLKALARLLEPERRPVEWRNTR